MARLLFVNIFIVTFLWIVVNMASVKSLPHEGSSVGHKKVGLKKGHLMCHCGKSKKVVEKDLDLKSTKKIFRDIKQGKDFLENIKYLPELKQFKDCSRCNLTIINCTTELCTEKVVTYPLLRNRSLTNTTVNKSKHDIEKIADDVLETIDIPVGGNKNHSLQRRQVGCSYPTSMETSAIACRVYPSFIKCVQKCAFGYTLVSGIRKEMQCNFKENRWIPSGFKECQPFVDCGVTLISGGSAKCATASIETPQFCNIECMHYEDKTAVPMAQYICNINGTWSPPLPFCAVSGTGLVLASSPKVKLHNNQQEQ